MWYAVAVAAAVGLTLLGVWLWGRYSGSRRARALTAASAAKTAQGAAEGAAADAKEVSNDAIESALGVAADTSLSDLLRPPSSDD